MSEETKTKYMNFVTNGGVTLMQSDDSGPPTVLGSVAVEDIAKDAAAMLLWTLVQQNHEITDELRKINKRADDMVEAGPPDVLGKMREMHPDLFKHLGGS